MTYFTDILSCTEVMLAAEKNNGFDVDVQWSLTSELTTRVYIEHKR